MASKTVTRSISYRHVIQSSGWARRSSSHLQPTTHFKSSHEAPTPKQSLRPRPHVSGDFCIRKFFYADTPSLHTCPPYTLGVSGDFCIGSPEWKFLYTLCIRIRVDARIRIFGIRWRHSIRTSLFPREIFQNGGMLCWLILWDVRIRIGYLWTVVYDSYTLRVDADIFVSA